MSDAIEFGVDAFKTVGERLADEREMRLRLADRVMPFNVSYLDDCCLGIYPTDLIVVCAASGAGKTSIAALISQLAAAQGRRVHFFALEAHRSEIEQRMLFREICNVLRERGVYEPRVTFQSWMYGFVENIVTEAIEDQARQRLTDEGSTMRTYYRGQAFTPEDITATFSAVRNETDLIVLDHLHYVDGDDPNENRVLKQATRAIRDSALAMERPVVVVAHLRKKDRGRPRLIPDIDDVHGASDIVKIATKVIMLAPARDQQSADPGVASTYMQVVKDRFAGVSGWAALCAYDLRTLRYREHYVIGRLSFNGEEFENVPRHAKPLWAVHGNATGTPPP